MTISNRTLPALTQAIKHGIGGATTLNLAPLSGDAALAATFVTPSPMSVIPVFDRADLSPRLRQQIADALAGRMKVGEWEWGAVPLVLTNEIRRGNIALTPVISEYLRAYFDRHAKETETMLDAKALHLRHARPMTAIAMLVSNIESGLAAELIERWPREQSELRARAVARLATGPDGTAVGLLTYDTPWDSSVLTARLPDATRQDPWLVAPDLRVIGEWDESATRILCRDEGHWPERFSSRIGHLRTTGEWTSQGAELAGLVNLPPLSYDLMERFMDDLWRRGEGEEGLRLAANIVATALASDANVDVERGVSALLAALDKYPSLPFNGLKLLYLLPLNSETKDLWWDLAYAHLKQNNSRERFAEIESIAMAHGMVTLHAIQEFGATPALRVLARGRSEEPVTVPVYRMGR